MALDLTEEASDVLYLKLPPNSWKCCPRPNQKMARGGWDWNNCHVDHCSR